MDACKEFLNKTYSLFNWQLSGIEVNHDIPMVVKLREKINEKDTMDTATSGDKWPLQLTYGYEAFSEDPEEGEKCVQNAVKEIETSKDSLNVKYRVSFLHIALSTKASLLLKCDNRLKEVEDLVAVIKPVSAMSDEELSGLLAMKAKIFRYYGPNGTNKGIPWLREAVRKNPKEVEWKISLVVTFNRRRHFFKGGELKWEEIQEPVNILEEVLCSPDLTEKQMVICKYHLAVAYYDYTLGKKPSGEIEKCRREILRLCNEFYKITDQPMFVSFAAERFSQSKGPDKLKGMQIIDTFLEKFPNHVGVHVTACKIFKRQRDFTRALRHAQIAYDNGGYGAAWLRLECKVKLGHVFDAEEYFNEILTKFQDMFKKQTHLSASYFYFFSRQDPIRGAYHFEQVILEDPGNDMLRKENFCPWVFTKFIPLELAYNQIVLALRTHHSGEDLATLTSAKRSIEQICDVQTFNTSKNLVQAALQDSHPKNRFNSRRF